MFETTGSNPLLVTCNDFNDWVCKYDRFPKYLFNELIGSEFAKIWKINTPETSLINVDILYIPFEKYPSLSPILFNKDCFGSKLLSNSQDVNLSMLFSFKELAFRNRIKNKSDLLKIALFDIWLCNDDRHHNNNNLLLRADNNNYLHFYVIDHVALFNSSHLERELAELTEDDTILNTQMAELLLGKIKKLTNIVDKLVENFYLCTLECEDNIDDILLLVPDSWHIDVQTIRVKLKEQLFSDVWKKKCEINFRTLVQTLIIN